MKLYDYVDARGINIILDWARKLQDRDRAKLENKLDRLAGVTDHRDLPHLLAGPGIQGQQEIYKLQVGASGSEVALRPMVCRGPFDKNAEITLLVGAKEVGRKLPKGIAKKAEEHRQHILSDERRRQAHESAE